MQRPGFTKASKITALLMTLCSPVCSRGQKLIVTDADLIHHAKVIILSELHLSDLFPPYKRALIEQLYKEEGLTDLVLETGKSTAYLLNEYIATGDPNIMRHFLCLRKGIKITGMNSESISYHLESR